MQIRSSLKKKSMVALGLYLRCYCHCRVYLLRRRIPVRAKLQQNLDLRTELLSALITEPPVALKALLIV